MSCSERLMCTPITKRGFSNSGKSPTNQNSLTLWLIVRALYEYVLSARKMFDGLICTLGDGAGDSFCVPRPRWTIHLTTG
jgi:hypothetical protein